jgi:two-component system LytT family sensor kinase
MEGPAATRDAAPRARSRVAAGAVLFAAGVAVGTMIVRSPVQTRVPGGTGRPWGHLLRVLGPSTVPLYAAALSLPLFLWLAMRHPLDRRRWLGALPLWAAAVLAVTLAAETALLLATGGSLGHLPDPLFFLAMRSIQTLPVVAGSAAVAHVLALRGRAEQAAREAAEARAWASEARLGALADQLRPHFLFNTLQSVSTLLYRDPAAADATLGHLSELLRASLAHGGARGIPLGEEVRLTEEYLQIARQRFGDRLRARVEVPLELHDAAVPPLLLQPLVENALRHGLEERPGAGRIAVRARESEGALEIEVMDDGAGWKAPAAEGVGLRNVRERLAALYGDAARLEVGPGAEGGTTVRLRFPLRRVEG